MPEEANPLDIRIDRSARQRKDVLEDIEEMKQSIKARGIINPITVRKTESGEYVLVAGERRLTAALALGLPKVPIRLFENLSHQEAELIELEENIKRKELHWRDQVKAIGRIHALFVAKDRDWLVEQTAYEIGIHRRQMSKIIYVFKAIDDKHIASAEGIEQAYNTLQRLAERKAENVVNDIIAEGANLFGNATAAPPPVPQPNASPEPKPSSPSTPETSVLPLIAEKPSPQSSPQSSPPPPSGPIIQANFHEWIKTYSGPKFSFIHCDFPYGNYRGYESRGVMSVLETEEFYDNTTSVYWNLLDSLLNNLDRVMSYSAHMVFWFNMNFYTETVARMRKIGLMVHDHPLVWHKTNGGGGIGVAPGSAGSHPHRTYDTALIAVRGNRPLVRTFYNSYAAPTVANKIHPSQKPEPMLRYFFQMFVDETTNMLDPTCGSGASLRAAEDLGAKSVLGLELDTNYVQTANAKTLQARLLRQAGKTSSS